jgi:hypothetical protein
MVLFVQSLAKPASPQVATLKIFAAQPTGFPVRALPNIVKRPTVVSGGASERWHVPGTRSPAVTQKARWELPGHDWRAVSSAPAGPPDASWLFSASHQNEARLYSFTSTLYGRLVSSVVSDLMTSSRWQRLNPFRRGRKENVFIYIHYPLQYAKSYRRPKVIRRQQNLLLMHALRV